MKNVLLYAAVGTARQHVLEACAVCGRSVSTPANDKAASNIPKIRWYMLNVFVTPLRISLNNINRLVFKTERHCLFCIAELNS